MNYTYRKFDSKANIDKKYHFLTSKMQTLNKPSGKWIKILSCVSSAPATTHKS